MVVGVVECLLVLFVPMDSMVQFVVDYKRKSKSEKVIYTLASIGRFACSVGFGVLWFENRFVSVDSE